MVESYRLLLTQITKANLFSQNEHIKEISDEHIKYLVVDYHLIQLLFKNTIGDRMKHLREALERLNIWLEQMLTMEVMDQSTLLGSKNI